MNYIQLLTEYGFEYSASKIDLIFYQNLKDVVSLFGDRISEHLLSNVDFQLKTTHNFSMTYDLIKKELIRTFGEKTSDLILAEIHKNIQGGIISPNKPIQETLDEAKKEEILKLLQNIDNPERMLLLWKTERFKNQVFCEFFNRDQSKMLFFSSSGIIINGVKVISYDQILEDASSALRKEIQLTKQMCQFNDFPMIFIGSDDMSNWFRVGLADKFLKFRRSDADFFQEQLICRLCGLDMNHNIDKEMILKAISSFNTIITEDPPGIYRRKL